MSQLPSVSKALALQLVLNAQHLFPVTLEMLFLQSVRLAADRPHVWVSWDWLWPKAAAWSGFSFTTKSAWKQISSQVALTARTCQWGMLDASGKQNLSDESRYLHFTHSFCPFIRSFHPGLFHSAVWAAGPFPQHPWGEANPWGGV